MILLVYWNACCLYYHKLLTMNTEYPPYHDMQISYFIITNSSIHGDEKSFAWPQLPDKPMGDEFIQEVKAWHL